MARKRFSPQQQFLPFDAPPEAEQTAPEAALQAEPAPFAARVERSAINGTFVERVKASRPRSLFDPLPDTESDPVPDTPPPAAEPEPPVPEPPTVAIAAGEKAKARDIIAAIRACKQINGRPATAEEKQILARFCGFGPVALSIFPNPQTGRYKDGWQDLGEELKSLLTPEEYSSVRRTVINQYFTSPVVMGAMHDALKRLGVPANGLLLEPGCGVGRFISVGPQSYRYIGVELDPITGRIAQLLHPGHDIRIENFKDTRLPQIDAAIGNVPFADIKFDFHGHRLSLHDFFFAKSVDALKPGGVLALVTSHFTLDKQNASVRELLTEQADFLGAIRLPSDAFKREGTSVVTDIVFLRKRGDGEVCNHCDPEWIQTAPVCIEGTDISINRYFVNHPEMVLGTWSRDNRLYDDGYSLGSNGDLAVQLREAVGQLPEGKITEATAAAPTPATVFQPPPLPHISEGSFFVGDDRQIRQVLNGQGEFVFYGGSHCWAGGSMFGRRLADLIGLRDKARRVLQSQNEGWPEENRNAARRDLNWAYDRFVSSYGPINKTTFGQTKDGTTIRRMPNLVKFREDPDAMLVMSLEEYDEETGKATKAAIMKKDVVGLTPVVTSVSNAEEGLLVSLDRKGAVDLPFIAGLYGKPDAEIVRELGDLIYLDPELKTWQTADAYLSGNVRAKLKAAEEAGPEFARNAEALRAVQPEDVLPGDIDANLGAPWIPEGDIQAFATDLFKAEANGVQIGHLKQEATWSVDADYGTMKSVAATVEYGTPRINGVTLLELALNMKTPTIYDPDPHDSDKRVVNQEDTLAAKEKQKQIKEKFRAWVFTDPERTERLVRIYNDTYNNLRPRAFDGSHLEFPGMNPTMTLRQHQKDAVWRVMSAGNTLLAHVVGAGKTGCCAAAAMKMKQAGLAKKPMIAVPNHLLEQFAREFMQFYPNAKLLVAGKEDLTRERRKYLTAKIASGDWDAIIVTHSSFERIGMSKEYQEQFLREQIEEYDKLLCDGKNSASRAVRNLIKTIEKQKAKREEKLKDLLAQDKKDDGLVFDELGVDQLFIDEFQQYKNLDTPSKLERVAGIQTGGSERAFDLLMKSRYLHQLHRGHGLVGATGTPISNTMVEMYTLQRYFDPEGLENRGLAHFDAWVGNFGEVVETMEISPDGTTLKPRSRLAQFINLPELQQMFRAFADVQTAEMLNLPRPKLEGGKPHVISCPMSDDQHALQQELVARYDRLRSQKVDPREDNALAITTDGRKLALDARLLSSTALTPATSKLDMMVDIIVDTWERKKATRATQMVFCDMGVHPTPWDFSVYEELINKLIARGIPREQIASVGDADSDAKKQALFEKVRNGQVRILIGSTMKMGTGTNVQKRLAALHHLDAPWKPAEVEQRDGRILRQGNENEEVAIYRYVTEGSFDAYMWQALETKARFIAQVMTGENALRRAEDVGGQELSYAEVKAIASGNPAVLILAQADADLQRLNILRKNHLDEQYLATRNVRDLPGTIKRLKERLAAVTADKATLDTHDGLNVGGREGDTLTLLGNKLDALPQFIMSERTVPLGTYRGLRFGIILHPNWSPEIYLEGQATRRDRLRDNPGPRAILNSLDRLADGYAGERRYVEQDLGIAEGQLKDYQARVGKPFTHAAYIDKLEALRDRLRLGLSERAEEGAVPVAEIAARIQALKAEQTIEVAPVRTANRKLDAETPVTTRIKRKAEEATEEREGDFWQRRVASEENGSRRAAGS